MKKFTIPIILFLCGIGPQQAFSQIEADSLFYRITTSDGNNYVGTIVRQDSEIIILRTERIGEISIPKKDIVRLEQVSPVQTMVQTRKDWPENPQATRYFIGSNGYGLRRGEGYYQNAWVLFNQANVGVTDNFSIGAGLVPLFLFASPVTPVWITPRITIPVSENKFNVGVGALLGTLVGEVDATYGMLNAVATIGSRDTNVSFGLAYGFVEGELADRPLITIGAMLRTGSRGYIITENYFIHVEGQTYGLIFLGGRRMFQNVGLDYGGFIPVGDERIIVVPWLGISIPFGR
jgi:hypothetical protein